MTADDLIAEARRNRTEPTRNDAMSPSNLSEFLRLALGLLLKDIDYDADKAADGALAVRILAAIITNADDPAAKAVR
jgi:hypothetical protein